MRADLEAVESRQNGPVATGLLLDFNLSFGNGHSLSRLLVLPLTEIWTSGTTRSAPGVDVRTDTVPATL